MPQMKNVLEKLQALEKSRLIRLDVKLLLLILAAWILFWPHLRRAESLLLSGKEAYYHLHKGTIAIILSFLSHHLNLDIILLAKFIPIVIGLLTVLLFYEILRKLKFDYGVVILSTLILIISPSFIYLFGTLNAYTFTAFIFLLSLAMFIEKKEILGVLILYLIPFFGLVPTLLGLLLILIYSLKNQRFRLFLGALPSLILLKFSPMAGILPSYGHVSIISDFAGHYGLGLFILLLSAFGLKYLWQKKYKHAIVYIIILSLVTFSLMDVRVLSYLNFILVTLAALGLVSLVKSEWKSRLIKQLTVLIMIYGLIFSGLSYINAVSSDTPNKDVIDMMDYLRTIPQGNVFSQLSREPWIEYSGQGFVTDKNLFYATDIDEALEIINTKNIDYLWIDEKMKEDLWDEEEEGLQFLLEYSKNFRKKKINDYITLWEVVEE